MATIDMTSCDGCGEMADDGYNFVLPPANWITVHIGGIYDRYDVCSTACLEVLAMRLNGFVAEQAATAPSKTKPRKPRAPQANLTEASS